MRRGARVLAAAVVASAAVTGLLLAYLAAWLIASGGAVGLDVGLAARSLALSVATASAATIAAVAAAVPAGYVFSRGLLPWGRALEVLLLLPFAMPPVAVGAMLLFAFTGPLRPLDEALGIVFTVKGLVVAQYMVVYPMAVRVVKAGFDAVPPRYEAVARSLGCTWWCGFTRVALPMARRGLLAAAVLAFTRSLGEFGASAMLAGVKPDTATLPIAIYLAFGSGDSATGVALILVSAAAAAAALAVLQRLEPRR